MVRIIKYSSNLLEFPVYLPSSPTKASHLLQDKLEKLTEQNDVFKKTRCLSALLRCVHVLVGVFFLTYISFIKKSSVIKEALLFSMAAV